MFSSPTTLASEARRTFALAFPARFSRLFLWRTSDLHWERVAASAMARASRIVVDCTRLGPPRASEPGSGITYEAVVSSIHTNAARAYLVTEATGLRLPGPATLRVRAAPWWWLRHGAAVAGRIRDVLERRLPAEEAAFLARYDAASADNYAAAMFQDALQAARSTEEIIETVDRTQGRPDSPT